MSPVERGKAYSHFQNFKSKGRSLSKMSIFLILLLPFLQLPDSLVLPLYTREEGKRNAEFVYE